ncbi:MAG: penicillin-binding protein activator [Gammaproteobacteria bacterium]
MDKLTRYVLVPDRKWRLRRGALVLLLLISGGCAMYPFKRAAPVREPESVQRLLKAGDYGGAGRELLRVAEEAEPEGGIELRLRAAEAFLENNDARSASLALERMPALPQKDPRALWRDALWARASLLKNQPEEALSLLDLRLPADVDRRIQLSFQQTRAYAFEAMGNAGAVVRERAKLDALLASEAARAQNRRAIWAALGALKPEKLRALIPAFAGEPATGWLELALLAKGYGHDREGFAQQLAQWRQQRPAHPAARDALDQLYGPQGVLIRGPRQVAVLLPLEGRFAPAAAAIRDGVIAAWYEDAADPSRPMLKFYDADVRDIASMHQRAVDEGAEFVIGPLEKSGIQALAGHGALRVPTLALNQLGTLPGTQPAKGSNLYQFGLLPEQEAEQVASKAWADGFSRSVVLTPNGSWGERLFAAFRARYRSLGGEILGRETYPQDAAGDTAAVDRLSASIHQTKAVTHPGFGAKRVFLFLAAFPQQARQIYPLVRSQSALPIYATSHIHAEHQKPQRGLEGVVFADMPFLLPNSSRSATVNSPVQQDGRPQSTDFLRLYALGMDAYRLIPQLARLQVERFAKFPGATGRVGMDGSGRLSRELRWARFVDGQAQALL